MSSCNACLCILFFFSTTCAWQVVNGVIKDPVLGTKIDVETGDVVEWCPSFLGKLLSPILGPEPENAGVNVFKVRFQTLRCVSSVRLRSSDPCRFWLISVGGFIKFNPSLDIPNVSWLPKWFRFARLHLTPCIAHVLESMTLHKCPHFYKNCRRDLISSPSR